MSDHLSSSIINSLTTENMDLKGQVTRLRKLLKDANRGAQVNALVNRNLVDRIADAERALKPHVHRRPNRYGYWNDYE